MTRKPAQLEQLVNATQRLVRAVIRRETIRMGQRAKAAQQVVDYRAKRAEMEREAMKKLEKDKK